MNADPTAQKTDSAQDRKAGQFLVGYDRTVTRQDYLALTGALGYGDDVSEPAAHPTDLIDPLLAALHDGHEHAECPLWCDECDQWERPRSCDRCHGSGCLPNVALAYLECGDCAGTGTDHEPYTLTGTWRHHPPKVLIRPVKSSGDGAA